MKVDWVRHVKYSCRNALNKKDGSIFRNLLDPWGITDPYIVWSRDFEFCSSSLCLSLLLSSECVVTTACVCVCVSVSRGAGRERVDWSRSKGWSSVCGLNQAVALFLQVWVYFCGLWTVGTHPLWKCVTLRMQLLKTDPPHTQTDTQRTVWDALREPAIFNHKNTKPDLFLVQNGGDFIVSTHFITFLTGFF